ncbi:MAG: glycosyltransferase [Flavobacteriaceae bacterium]|nr:glycosyltransferase [Flavobacteriaceae bacterium]
MPSYNITYPKNGNVQWHLMKQIPHILKTIKTEHSLIQEIIQKENIDGIISDNRFGVWSESVPSVYITHQIKVLSGLTTFLSSYFHHKILHKFGECWIPDSPLQNLAGKLASKNGLKIPIKYIGSISRLKYQKLPIEYDICVLLSGPEPQRTVLENILLNEFQAYKGSICFIRGVISDTAAFKSKLPFTFFNYLTTQDLNNIINQSELIIARSGYSTILDLACLGKKAFFIPTPGQTEQEYLAKNFKLKGIAPFCKQPEFKLQKLDVLKNYSGFTVQENQINPSLFNLFT